MYCHTRPMASLDNLHTQFLKKGFDCIKNSTGHRSQKGKIKVRLNKLQVSVWNTESAKFIFDSRRFGDFCGFKGFLWFLRILFKWSIEVLKCQVVIGFFARIAIQNFTAILCCRLANIFTSVIERVNSIFSNIDVTYKSESFRLKSFRRDLR